MTALQEQFIEAARQGDVATLERLQDQVDPKAQCSKALAMAALYGHLGAAEFLHPLSDPEDIHEWSHLRTQTDPELILRMISWTKNEGVGKGYPFEYSLAMAIAANDDHQKLMRMLHLHACPFIAMDLCIERGWNGARTKIERLFIEPEQTIMQQTQARRL
jgi:hypothetical protein